MPELPVPEEDILDEMMGDGSEQECDFVQHVAVWGPLRMNCEILWFRTTSLPRNNSGPNGNEDIL